MSETSGAGTNIGTTIITCTTRKNVVKGRGVDWDLSRRNREDKTVQVRKLKRIDRVNIERRKFKLNEDSSDVTGGQQQGASRLHGGNSLLSHSRNVLNFQVLPRKCEMLLSEELEDQLNAAMFFRRILAADRNPPLDLVVQSSVLIPRLIEFLSRHDSPSLQLEVAWSITNIACGEARHISALVMSGVMLQLVLLVQATPHRKVRDQAMWAISNLTADADACRSALLIPTFLPTILSQVGLYCNAAVPIYVDIDSTMIIGDSLQQRSDDYPTACRITITQAQMKENPTLPVMRYVSLTCSNFVRLKDFPGEISAGQQHEVFRTVLFCMSDMVQSPDEEIVVEICNTLASLLPERTELVDVVLEYGMVSRMFEMVVASNLHASGVVFEMALVVLCVILRSPNPLHRSAVLSSRSTAAAQCYCYSKRLSTAAAAASESRCGAPHEATLLSYIVQYLSRGACVNAATAIDLVRGLSVIVEEEPLCLVDSAHISIVADLLRGDSHDLKVEVGQFLCKLVLVPQVDPMMQQLGWLDAAAVLRLASCWAAFLTTDDDPSLLFNSLRSLCLVFQYAVQQPGAAYSFDVLHCGQLKDHAASLAFHPVREIAAAAAHLEDCILSYMHSSDDW